MNVNLITLDIMLLAIIQCYGKGCCSLIEVNLNVWSDTRYREPLAKVGKVGSNRLCSRKVPQSRDHLVTYNLEVPRREYVHTSPNKIIITRILSALH